MHLSTVVVNPIGMDPYLKAEIVTADVTLGIVVVVPFSSPTLLLPIVLFASFVEN